MRNVHQGEREWEVKVEDIDFLIIITMISFTPCFLLTFTSSSVTALRSASRQNMARVHSFTYSIVVAKYL